jgi:hypothetical protein
MRSIRLDITREPGEAPRIAIKLDNNPRITAFLPPEDVGTWLQGFIAALPPLTDHDQ